MSPRTATGWVSLGPRAEMKQASGAASAPRFGDNCTGGLTPPRSPEGLTDGRAI